MRMRLVFCFFAIALFVSISVVGASRQMSGVNEKLTIKTAGVHDRGSVNYSYRSPGKLHKAVVSTDDPDALARAHAAGAIEIADYGSFKLFALDASALERAEELGDGQISGGDGV
ncbi:MAG TPA: hypothetical protein VLG74_11265, partial [Blastocatellia bacterium]|nr:hypothetical protein [Blastocatellia bacterium]